MTDVQPQPQAEPVVSLPVPAFRVMDVEDVSMDLPSPYPAVTLVESEPPMRALVFPVGLPEGTAMAQALRRMDSRRPMTHELFMQVMQQARIDVIAVRLTGRDEGNLLAELDLMTPGGGCGWTAVPPTASCWRCACRSRPRSWPTSACSRTWATSSRSRTTCHPPTGPSSHSVQHTGRGSDLIGS